MQNTKQEIREEREKKKFKCVLCICFTLKLIEQDSYRELMQDYKLQRVQLHPVDFKDVIESENVSIMFNSAHYLARTNAPRIFRRSGSPTKNNQCVW